MQKCPFTAATGVRIPLGTPRFSESYETDPPPVSKRWPIYRLGQRRTAGAHRAQKTIKLATIEFTVRHRVKQHANIIIREHCRVRELVASADGAVVSAIRFDNSNGQSETLPADLVVEASGRGGLTTGFLESVRRPRPEETTIGVDIVYATAVFAVPDNAPADWKAVMTFDPPARGVSGCQFARPCSSPSTTAPLDGVAGGGGCP